MACIVSKDFKKHLHTLMSFQIQDLHSLLKYSKIQKLLDEFQIAFLHLEGHSGKEIKREQVDPFTKGSS